MNQMTPEQQARVESMKKTWAARRKLTERLDRIKCRLAVYSGKGGVGKTSVAVNLAVLMAKRGAKVGLLDADIDCPNVLGVLKANSKPQFTDGQITPAEMHGVKVVSMGLFQENPEEAIIWRGPMVHNAINQFLEMTDWGDLDYLVVDMPPGTSDAPLTIMQMLQLEGFIIVTTPQELALLDAKRSTNMVRKMNLKVLGVVENMAGDVFGTGGGEELAAALGTSFLGRISLNKEFRSPKMPPVLESKLIQKEFEVILNNLERVLAAAPSG